MLAPDLGWLSLRKGTPKGESAQIPPLVLRFINALTYFSFQKEGWTHAPKCGGVLWTATLTVGARGKSPARNAATGPVLAGAERVGQCAENAIEAFERTEPSREKETYETTYPDSDSVLRADGLMF
jgi:hypothetical protein